MDVKISNKANSHLNFVFKIILPKSKRSQVTIFIIIAVIIVVVLLLIFLLRRPPDVQTVDETNPQAFIDLCTTEALEQALSILLPQGGDITPKGSLLYDNVERVYLCYNSRYFKPCINQRPMLVEHIQDEITAYIRPKVEQCFHEIKTKLSERYVITERELTITTELKPRHINIKLDKYFRMEREGIIQEFEEFKTTKNHPMYDLAEVAMEIVNQEAEYCHFANLGYMIIYPEFDISKFETGNGNIVYSVRDIKTDQEFVFAVRGCVIPPPAA